MIWLILLGLVAATIVGGTVYMTAAVGRFGLISSIDQKWLKIVVSLGIIVLAFTAVTLIMSLVNEDIVFTHMSGKQQTKEEFFGEIADGTLNYYSYELHGPVVTVDGDTAKLTGSTTLKAKVYGASGTWTLPTNAHFVKINGNWICTN